MRYFKKKNLKIFFPEGSRANVSSSHDVALAY